MRALVRFCRSLLLFCFLALPAPADAQPPGSLAGRVADSDGLPLPDVAVVVTRDGLAVRTTRTDAGGRFSLPHLPAGTWRLTAHRAGFADAGLDVTVPAVGLALRLEPAAVIEAVTVVSASRELEQRDALSTRVDVVTRARMEESGAETVAEALRELPGVLTRRGSETAGAAGEQIQGIDSRQVLVLIDGLPIVGARGIKRGVINLDRQSTSRLDRVEVVKGAASTLYGSDAIGGVVNLITRDPHPGLELGGALMGGSHGDRSGRADAGVGRQPLSALASVEHRTHDGFDLTPTTFDTTGAPFDRTDLFAKLQWQAAPSLHATGLLTGYRNETQGRSVGELGPQEDAIDETALNAGASAGWRLSDVTGLELRLAHARYDESSTGRLGPPTFAPLAPGELDERLTRVDATLSRFVGTRQQLQAGAEWTRNTYAGINRLRDDRAQRATTGVAWGQHRWSPISRLTTTLGLRVDRHSAFGTAVSPKAAATYLVTPALRARVSYGRGFRAPDLGQLYYRFLNPTNFYQVIGNPALDPERAHSLQLGTELVTSGRRSRVGVNVFRNQIQDLIESVSLGFVATPAQLQAILAREGIDRSFNPLLGRLLFVYRNVSDAVTRGVELDGEIAATRRVSVSGAYTYLDAYDAASGRALTNRHRHQGHARVAWQAPWRGLRANLRGTFYSSWVAARTTTGGDTIDTVAPRFALWDAYVSQPLVRGAVLYLAIDNLADSRDPNTGVLLPSGTPAAIYRPEVGRTFRVGLRYTWSPN